MAYKSRLRRTLYDARIKHVWHFKNNMLRTTSEARVNRRLRRYYLIVLLLLNAFTLACLLLSSIKYDMGHLMVV